ncbi:unnamed protein product [Urochloa decumbens]|uniref:F-box protein AT5G49610-like beta-propeller domain-containing protein n=1 Tax=Urochloa decumbens TaxID=240449 RepID=A0ABC9DYL2_9POAL
MASQQQPAPAAKPQAPAPTTITTLGEDLLCESEIFVRLPSLPSLVRAAAACRAFHAAVRSSPSFRRRFRALHPPPLLGIFFDSDGTEMPTFTPIRRRSDPDLAAAVRDWQVAECRGGYLLLLNWRSEQIAAYNPLTRALDVIPMPPDEISDDCRGEFVYTDFFLIFSEEAPGSFRVVSLCHDESRLRAAVFLSTTREWQILPWTEDVPAQPSGEKHWLRGGTQAGGLLCWSHARKAYKVVLDTVTLQFSFIDLPEHLKGKGYLYMAGETNDGKLCIVSAVEFTLFVWLRRADADDDVQKWMLDSVIPLEGEVLRATESSRADHGAIKLKVWAILDGIVYMSTFETFRDYTQPCWFLSFCLVTKKLEKIFRKRNDSHVHPYTMAWPPSLVGNNFRP